MGDLKCHILKTQMKGALRFHTVRGFRVIVASASTQLKALKVKNNCDAPLNAATRGKCA